MLTYEHEQDSYSHSLLQGNACMCVCVCMKAYAVSNCCPTLTVVCSLSFLLGNTCMCPGVLECVFGFARGACSR